MKKANFMPKWIKKYIPFILEVNDEEEIQYYLEHPPIHYLENPTELVKGAKIRVQVELLKKLYQKGFLK